MEYVTKIIEQYNQLNLPLNRKFGIEIEFLGLYPNETSEILSEHHIECRSEGYNHDVRSWWKATTDGSLSDRRSTELVSPPLPFNEESLITIGKIFQILTDNGGYVDQSCGIHVHIDARDLSRSIQDFSRFLFIRYRESENTIDSLVAPNRRSNNNTYCTSMKQLPRTTKYSRLRNNRYQKLNFCSFERHGTIEFRQHEGSLNGPKVNTWISFCMFFFEDTRKLFLQEGSQILENIHTWE